MSGSLANPDTWGECASRKVRIVNWQDAELAGIESREDLARYLASLAARLREGDISTENPSAEAFIDAAARWTKSSRTFRRSPFPTVLTGRR
jgi:predicted RNA polymerase sigma factor